MAENLGDALMEFEDEVITQMKSTGQFFSDSLRMQEIPEEIIGMVPREYAAKYHIIPLKEADGALVLVTDQSETLQSPSLLEDILDRPVELLLADAENVKAALASYYGVSNYSGARSADLENAQANLENTPLQKKVDEVLQFGASVNGSDIHIKPYAKGIYVWIRINGVLRDFTDQFDFNRADGDMVTNIIKGKDTSSNADSGNKLMPNNGAFSIQRAGVPIRCRLATIPDGSATDMVQKLDVRLMPQKTKRLALDTMYFNEDLEAIRNVLFRSSSGMFINAGPVGTGKTTSLYSQIDYLWNLAQKHNNLIHVYTIENPIEIRDERYTQVQVRESKDETISLTPLVALDSALRSDPDIILFGEVRNKAEADAAMKASQTGLKMFTTIHAANCVKTILRLLNLGVDPLSMLSEMRFVLCQRLLPLLCPDCCREHTLTPQERAILSEEEIHRLEQHSLKEKGSIESQKKCQNPHCHDGILKRVAVPEYIIFDNDIRDALLNQNDFHSVNEILKKHNFVTMWDKGMRLVCNGHVELNDLIAKVGKE